MLLVKMTAITSIIALLLTLLVEGWFAASSRPYLFGFPRTRWPLFVVMFIAWAVGARCAYFLVFERSTFY